MLAVLSLENRSPFQNNRIALFVSLIVIALVGQWLRRVINVRLPLCDRCNDAQNRARRTLYVAIVVAIAGVLLVMGGVHFLPVPRALRSLLPFVGLSPGIALASWANKRRLVAKDAEDDRVELTGVSPLAIMKIEEQTHQ
jgi:hypothetical protein